MKYLTGFHSIEERIIALLKDSKNQSKESGEYKIFYSKPGPRIKKILEEAKKTGITSEQVSNQKLDEICLSLQESLRDHRGIVMSVSGEDNKAQNLVNFDSWLLENSSKQKSTVVILDKVTDPHNVGAIIRSCDQFGADLIILPEHNSASNISDNEIIGRTSAGASAWVNAAVVNNLVRVTEQLKANNYWIYGADAGGESCCNIEFAEKSVIIMGSEGKGISPLLRKQCDCIVSIPTCGKIDSLNVSVATGVLLYELYKRNK